MEYKGHRTSTESAFEELRMGKAQAQRKAHQACVHGTKSLYLANGHLENGTDFGIHGKAFAHPHAHGRINAKGVLLD